MSELKKCPFCGYGVRYRAAQRGRCGYGVAPVNQPPSFYNFLFRLRTPFCAIIQI